MYKYISHFYSNITDATNQKQQYCHNYCYYLNATDFFPSFNPFFQNVFSFIHWSSKCLFL